MRNIISLFLLAVSINAFVLIYPAEKMTVDEFKSKIASIKRPEIKSMECEIEIEMDGKIIGSSKMYMKGDKSRLEIKGDASAGVEDMVIIQDSTQTYLKTGNKWEKSLQKNEIINQIYTRDQSKMLNELTQKKEFKVESYMNNKATISYKETSPFEGVQNIRIGIDMKTGNIMFIEQKSNMANGVVSLEYTQAEYIPTKIISSSYDVSGGHSLQFTLLNLKINRNIQESLFTAK